LLQKVVAFEINEYEPNGDVGWSVLVQGVAAEVTAVYDIAQARQLPLRLISAGGEFDRFVRVEIARISGRRVRPHSERSSYEQLWLAANRWF
jgi:hypothetical protein